MCYDQVCLGYMLVAVIAGFAGLIYLLLRSRKSFLEKNLLITSDQVWSTVSDRALKARFSKSDLLFAVVQDKSATLPVLIVKNHTNEIVGRVEFPMARRELKILAGSETFCVNFPLTWNRTAHLSAENNKLVLASYSKLNIFGRHKFDMPGYGTIISQRPKHSLSIIFNYFLNNNLVGTRQEISKIRQVGRLVVLPQTLPLHLRIFILAI